MVRPLPASARRGFCPICGSNLFWDGPGAHLSIFAGTLDGDPGIRLAGHIHCADKGAYYDIADGLPQVPGADPGLTVLMREARLIASRNESHSLRFAISGFPASQAVRAAAANTAEAREQADPESPDEPAR